MSTQGHTQYVRLVVGHLVIPPFIADNLVVVAQNIHLDVLFGMYLYPFFGPFSVACSTLPQVICILSNIVYHPRLVHSDTYILFA